MTPSQLWGADISYGVHRGRTEAGGTEVCMIIQAWSRGYLVVIISVLVLQGDPKKSSALSSLEGITWFLDDYHLWPQPSWVIALIWARSCPVRFCCASNRW